MIFEFSKLIVILYIASITSIVEADSLPSLPGSEAPAISSEEKLPALPTNQSPKEAQVEIQEQDINLDKFSPPPPENKVVPKPDLQAPEKVDEVLPLQDSNSPVVDDKAAYGYLQILVEEEDNNDPSLSLDRFVTKYTQRDLTLRGQLRVIEYVNNIVKEQVDNQTLLPKGFLFPSIDKYLIKFTKYKNELSEFKKSQATPTEVKSDKKEVVKINEFVPQIVDKFAEDETIMLQIPDDDVELGKLTEEAVYENMSFDEYVKVFWANYQSQEALEKRASINSFLEGYPDKFNFSDTIDYARQDLGANPHLSKPFTLNDAKVAAIEAIKNDDLELLRTMIDNFSLINMADSKGNNLLLLAISAEKVEIVEYLLRKNINLFHKNYDNMDALSLASLVQNTEILSLLEEALKRRKR